MGSFPSSRLLKSSKTAHFLPKSCNILMLWGQLYNDICSVTVTAEGLTIEYDGIAILTWLYDKVMGLWKIDLQDTTLHQEETHHIPVTNNALFNATKPELARYYHVACFVPDIST